MTGYCPLCGKTTNEFYDPQDHHETTCGFYCEMCKVRQDRINKLQELIRHIDNVDTTCLTDEEKELYKQIVIGTGV